MGFPGRFCGSDELDVLTTLIEAYEHEHYPIDLPNPIEAIKFRLEQKGKDTRALIGVIGQRTRVYEVMRGTRPLSLNMIRRLHEKFDIPAEVLIQPTRRSRNVAVHGMQVASGEMACANLPRPTPPLSIPRRQDSPTSRSTLFLAEVCGLTKHGESTCFLDRCSDRNRNVIQVAAKRANLRRIGE